MMHGQTKIKLDVRFGFSKGKENQAHSARSWMWCSWINLSVGL